MIKYDEFKKYEKGMGKIMKSGNPFTLTFGKPPKTAISRSSAIAEITESFSAENPLSHTYLICGIRGSGKTVLMTTVANALKENGDWIIADLNPEQDLLDDLSMRLADAMKKIPNYFEKGFDLSAFGFGIGVGGTNDNKDSVSRIENLLDYAVKKNKRILITIDEVSKNRNMKIFASQFQIFMRKDYPVFLIMTGLYEKISSIQNDSSLTFLLRSPKITLGALSERQISLQYKEHLNIDDIKATEFANFTKGYAFCFQAFGLLYYEYSDSLESKQIRSKVDDLLDDFVYKKIWEGMSGNEKLIMSHLSDENMTKVSSICTDCGITEQSLCKYRDLMLKKGYIYSPKHGYIIPALPDFVRITSFYGL